MIPFALSPRLIAGAVVAALVLFAVARVYLAGRHAAEAETARATVETITRAEEARRGADAAAATARDPADELRRGGFLRD